MRAGAAAFHLTIGLLLIALALGVMALVALLDPGVIIPIYLIVFGCYFWWRRRRARRR